MRNIKVCKKCQYLMANELVKYSVADTSKQNITIYYYCKKLESRGFHPHREDYYQRQELDERCSCYMEQVILSSSQENLACIYKSVTNVFTLKR